MHHTSWFAYATLCITTVSAFYPYKEASNSEEDSANILPQPNNVQEHVKGQTTTIDIKKRRTKVSLAPVARCVFRA